MIPEDPLAALARIIGGSRTDCCRRFALGGTFCDDCPATIDNRGVYPRVRQVPWKYHTEEYGPVFAYSVTNDKKAAACVNAADEVVYCTHDQLLPFRVDVSGADVIETLDEEISEMISPHMDGRSYKYQRPRRSTIGTFLFHEHIWQGVVEP